MRQLFVDTSAYFALTDRRDENHEAAVRIIHQLIRERTELLTTNYIVAETHTLLLNRIGYKTALQVIISLIDILWLKGANTVAAAFEVEHTTSIYSGLLRMSDLIALAPNINFPLFIVTPEVRLNKVQQELSRPTFQILELHKRCGFFSEEKLLQEAEYIMRWANDPSAIGRLASKVGDVIG